MSVYKKVIGLLKANRINYQQVTHSPVYTMKGAEKETGSKPEEGVKVLFLQSVDTDSFCLAIWSGNKKVDFNKIANVLKVKAVSLASPEDVEDQLGINVGSLSPFGYTNSFPVIFDRSLLEQEKVYINPGLHHKTLMLNPLDLKKLLPDSNPEFYLV